MRAGSSVALLKPICYLDDLRVNEIFSEETKTSDSTVEVISTHSGSEGNCSGRLPEGHQSIVSTHPDLSNRPLQSNTDCGRISSGMSGNLSPVHSSVNPMVSDGSSPPFGYMTAMSVDDCGPHESDEDLSEKRVASWNCYSGSPLLNSDSVLEQSGVISLVEPEADKVDSNVS